MKFFVPSAFDKSADIVKFKPTLTVNKNNANKAKKNNKNNKNKNKNKSDSLPQGRGPLAPKFLDAEDEEMPSLNKVKQGKIEKKKNNKKQQKLKQKLKLTPALSKAIQKTKNSKDEDNDSGDNEAMDDSSSSPNISAGNSFEAKLKSQLMGGRFRFINEQLYTMNSKKAETLFKEDPEAFKAYHDGYRHQVKKWPLNPLDRIIKMIKKLPKSLEIGDFGCGEGKLAKSVPNKVYSMDLVSCRDDIIACDIAETPLASQSLDVAVYCLSLMGTNLKDYLLEANRVLKMDGIVYIAEIQSRFDNVKDFVKKLDAFGFQLVRQEVGQKIFYFFHFKKIRNVGRVANVPQFSLKPCLYRKR